MKKIFLTLLAAAAVFTLSAQQYKAPLVVANGGFHQHPSSGVKNSMSALKAAQKQKVYGSECDVNLTRDGKVLIVQSGAHPNKKTKPRVNNVQASTAKRILSIPYTNGERVCTLEQFLERAAKKPATKLILDIKSQSTIQRETRLVKKVVEIVENAGMQNNVEYIANHQWACMELAKYAPNSKIYYLGGNYDPSYVKNMGCTGIDYEYSKIKKKKGWIAMAHKLGMPVNIWTVDNEIDIRWCIQNGADIITTNNPPLVKRIIKEMCIKEKKKRK